ncbi:MAG TPA: hypothetical protein VMG12_45280 [Polyangiaceae bacterium]|nr:hypothetical protein [Polyangiaceae bacterium]
MAFVNAGPSPASLGVVAILSFGGLVAAAFASGYHLASHSGAAKAATDQPAAEKAGVSAASDAEGASSAANAAAFAPIPGRIAEPLVDRERAVLLAAPDSGDVVDELPSGRSVTISRESGDWLFVRYTRDGKEREGWAHRINIERDEP